MVFDSDSNKTRNIPVLILAGGLGTRIAEETHNRPKPLVEIGGTPILLHIMRFYYSFGFTNFVICAGFKHYEIKRLFADYELRNSNLEIDNRNGNSLTLLSGDLSSNMERWRVRILNTGLNTMTGARVARALDIISEQEAFTNFALTYGDGLTDANLLKELDFHMAGDKTGTVLGVKNIARFGELNIEGESVKSFSEKPDECQGFINGGFFFFKRDFRKYLNPKEDFVLEKDALPRLASQGELKIFKHTGFWHAVDSLRDKNILESIMATNNPPWILHANNRTSAMETKSAQPQLKVVGK